jgi:glycosyltransferase involved in cell wall biosynthesis
MRILHLNNRWEAGGTQRHLIDLTKGLESRGHEVWTAAWSLNLEHPGGMNFIPLPLYRDLGRRKSPLGFIQSLRVLSDFLIEHHFDLVHMHSRYVLPLGYYLTKNSDIPRIYTVHYHTTDLKSIPWYPGQLLFPSSWLRQRFLETISRPSRFTTRVIPHGLSSGSEHRPQQSDFFRTRTLVFVGRHTEEKGGVVFLRAIRILQQKGIPCNAVFVGDGEARSLWEKIVLDWELQDSVSFIGHHPSPEQFLSTATACIIPSLRPEGFGYVVIEALSSGCPVIASDLPSYREIDGGNDFVQFFEPGNANALAAIIEDQLQHPADQTIASTACTYVRNEFDLHRMIGQTIDAYQSCLETKLEEPA